MSSCLPCTFHSSSCLLTLHVKERHHPFPFTSLSPAKKAILLPLSLPLSTVHCDVSRKGWIIHISSEAPLCLWCVSVNIVAPNICQESGHGAWDSDIFLKMFRFPHVHFWDVAVFLAASCAPSCFQMELFATYQANAPRLTEPGRRRASAIRKTKFVRGSFCENARLLLKMETLSQWQVRQGNVMILFL